MERTIFKRLMTATLPLVVAFFWGLSFYTSLALADDKTEANQLVEKAKMTFENFIQDENMKTMVNLLKDAKGVFIAPQVLRGAFIVGASGGSGIFVARDKNNNWFGPTFYTLGGLSVGLQAGGDASEVILVAMTERGVKAFQSTNFKLGADVGIALGPAGAGIAAQTANLSADIVSFSRAKGLYAGISLDGAVVAARNDLNRAFYGKEVTPSEILSKSGVSNPKVSVLLQEIARAANKHKN